MTVPAEQGKTSETPETDALIEDMRCGDGIPVCEEWERLEAKCRDLERQRNALRASGGEVEEVVIAHLKTRNMGGSYTKQAEDAIREAFALTRAKGVES